jgi:hypothetical protein
MGTPESPNFDPNKSKKDLEAAATKWAYQFMGSEPPRPPRNPNLIKEFFNKDSLVYYLTVETDLKDVAIALGLAGIVAGAVAIRVLEGAPK